MFEYQISQKEIGWYEDDLNGTIESIIEALTKFPENCALDNKRSIPNEFSQPPATQPVRGH